MAWGIGWVAGGDEKSMAFWIIRETSDRELVMDSFAPLLNVPLKTAKLTT
jgi:hypothetical protein